MRDGVAEEMLAYEANVHARLVRRAARHGVVWREVDSDAFFAGMVRYDTLEARAALSPQQRYYALIYDAILRRYGYPICNWPRHERERLYAIVASMRPSRD